MVGDLVRAVSDSTGVLWFDGIARKSRRSLIRIVFFEPWCEHVATRLQAMGCGTEGMEAFKLLAVDVPADVELDDVQIFLQAEASAR